MEHRPYPTSSALMAHLQSWARPCRRTRPPRASGGARFPQQAPREPATAMRGRAHPTNGMAVRLSDALELGPTARDSISACRSASAVDISGLIGPSATGISPTTNLGSTRRLPCFGCVAFWSRLISTGELGLHAVQVGWTLRVAPRRPERLHASSRRGPRDAPAGRVGDDFVMTESS